MKCPTCGREYPDDLKECPYCNPSITKEIKSIKQEINYLKTLKEYLEKSINNIESSLLKIEERISIKQLEEKRDMEHAKEVKSRAIKEKKNAIVEQFLGEKLLLTIGIIAVLFATAFFLKYSYENNLFTPFIRVMITTFLGIVLITSGYILKGKFKIFGIILLTGGIAVLFFSNFASVILFNFYGTITAFLLNLALVICSLFLAIKFDSQWVSIVGIGGAYLSPLSLKATLTNDIGFFIYLFVLSFAPLFLAYKKKWSVIILLSNFLNIVWFYRWYSYYFKANVSIYFIYFGIWYFTIFLVATLFYIERDMKYTFYIQSALLSTFLYPLISVKTLELAKKSLSTPSIVYILIGLILVGLTYLKDFEEKKKSFLITSGILTVLIGIYFNFKIISTTSFLAITLILSILLYFLSEEEWIPTLNTYLILFLFFKAFPYDIFSNFSLNPNFTFPDYSNITSRILEYFIVTAALWINAKVGLKKGKEWFSHLMAFLTGIYILIFLTFETLTAFFKVFHKGQSMAVSVLWAIFAFVLFFTGLKKENRDLKLSGLTLFTIVLFKLFIVDIQHLSALYRVLSFFITGIVLIISSYFYYKLTNKKEVKEDKEE